MVFFFWLTKMRVVGSIRQAKKGFILLAVYILQSRNHVENNYGSFASNVGWYAHAVHFHCAIHAIECGDWNHSLLQYDIVASSLVLSLRAFFCKKKVQGGQNTTT